MIRNAPLLAALLAATACKPPPEGPVDQPRASVERGRQAIVRAGCGSCHTIPGIDWPQGATGPALAGLAERGLIGGRLPNRPDVLAAFVRDAPALVPEIAMPAMPLSEQEARDIASYLYAMGA